MRHLCQGAVVRRRRKEFDVGVQVVASLPCVLVARARHARLDGNGVAHLQCRSGGALAQSCSLALWLRRLNACHSR